MSKTEYQNRWVENPINATALKKITKMARKGGVLKKEHSPFGVLENGLIDFRGLRLSGINIKRMKIKDADLSFSDFYNTILDRSVFNNIKFQQVDFTKLRDWGNDFRNVHFLKCKFIEAGMGYKGTNFQSSLFEECNFSKTNFTRAEFNNCRIINCKLNGIDFFGSSFEDCSFVGTYKDLWFRGGYPHPDDKKDFGRAKKNEMKNVSFEEAKLMDITYSNDCDLSSVKLPKTGNYKFFDFWQKRICFLNSKIDQFKKDEQKEVDVFVYSFSGHAKTQPNYIINVDFIKAEFGEELTEKMIQELENAL